MATYRMVYGDNEEIVRETYTDITSIEREDGWAALFRGPEAICACRKRTCRTWSCWTTINTARERPDRKVLAGRLVSAPAPVVGFSAMTTHPAASQRCHQPSHGQEAERGRREQHRRLVVIRNCRAEFARSPIAPASTANKTTGRLAAVWMNAT